MTYYQLVNIYQKIKERITSYQLEPVVQVEYQRESFRDRNKQIRITFDQYLSFKAIQNSFTQPVKEFDIYSVNAIIMEIKTTGSRPAWLKDITARYSLKKRRFSKYCTSVEHIYAPQYNACPQRVDLKEEKYAGIS